MSASITIPFTNIKTASKRHLSIIGKRLYTKDGKNLFSDITLSSNEDPILNIYIQTAAQNIESALRQLITVYTLTTDTSVSMTITNTRHARTSDSAFGAQCQQMFETYMMLFTVGEYLAMVHPELAEKYYRDATAQMNTILAFVFYKGEPPVTVGPIPPTPTPQTPPTINTTGLTPTGEANVYTLVMTGIGSTVEISYTLNDATAISCNSTNPNVVSVTDNASQQKVTLRVMAAGSAEVVLNFEGFDVMVDINVTAQSSVAPTGREYDGDLADHYYWYVRAVQGVANPIVNINDNGEVTVMADNSFVLAFDEVRRTVVTSELSVATYVRDYLPDLVTWLNTNFQSNTYTAGTYYSTTIQTSDITGYIPYSSN